MEDLMCRFRKANAIITARHWWRLHMAETNTEANNKLNDDYGGHNNGIILLYL
jgi:hypothetical protein